MSKEVLPNKPASSQKPKEQLKAWDSAESDEDMDDLSPIR